MLVLVVVLLTIAPAGFPVKPSFVYSDSMEPTLGTNDGFVVVPAGTVESGTIVTFWSARRGSHVTHRVVGRTDGGFLTKGDNNPTTDQAAGHSPVRRQQIVGRVLTVHGTPLVIPGYGAAVKTVRANRLVTIGLFGAAALLSDLFAGDRSDGRTRSVPKVRDVLQPLFLVSAGTLLAFVLLGTTVHQMTFVAMAGVGDAPRVLDVDESKNVTLIVTRSDSPFTRHVVTADGMAITNETRNSTRIALTARVPPPKTEGRYVTQVSVQQYPAVLPASSMERLHRLHPILAASVTTLLALGPLYLGSVLLLDGGAPLRPSRSRWRHRLREVLQ